MNRLQSDRGAIHPLVVFFGVIALLGGGWGVSTLISNSTTNPQGITLSVTSARAVRDGTDLPVAEVDVSVDYQSIPTAQAQETPPTVRCTMTQDRLTTADRTFSSEIILIGNTRVVPGKVVIAPGENGRNVEGSFSIRCELVRNGQVIATADGPDVEVPEVGTPADLSYMGRYSIGPSPGSQCRGGETFDFTYTIVTDSQLNPHKVGKFVSNSTTVDNVPLGEDMSFSFNIGVGLENPEFGGTVTGGFIAEVDRRIMVGTVELKGTLNPDCTYQFRATRE